MEAIVLAGGFGTRLRSVVSDVPKPMAPVAGRPFLELLLCSLKAKGITRAILSVGYMSEVITSHFQKRPIGIDLEYEVESTPLGTGGAIAAALRHVTRDHVFVFNGDTYLDLDLSAVAAMWPGDQTPIVVARSVPDTERFGALELANGRISHFLGSGQKGAGAVNAGCYLIPRNVFAVAGLPDAFSFEQDFLGRRPPMSLRVFLSNGQFIDIGVPEDYQRAQHDLAGLAGSATESAELESGQANQSIKRP
jgi:D-glycero-alpha-D-manno-heptose 1-phosphate guanylyltransferase